MSNTARAECRNTRADPRFRHQIKRQRSTITRSTGGPVSICSTCLEMVGRTTKERFSAGGKIATTNASVTGGANSAETVARFCLTSWQHLPHGIPSPLALVQHECLASPRRSFVDPEHCGQTLESDGSSARPGPLLLAAKRPNAPAQKSLYWPLAQTHPVAGRPLNNARGIIPHMTTAQR